MAKPLGWLCAIVTIDAPRRTASWAILAMGKLIIEGTPSGDDAQSIIWYLRSRKRQTSVSSLRPLKLLLEVFAHLLAVFEDPVLAAAALAVEAQAIRQAAQKERGVVGHALHRAQLLIARIEHAAKRAEFADQPVGKPVGVLLRNERKSRYSSTLLGSLSSPRALI